MVGHRRIAYSYVMDLSFNKYLLLTYPYKVPIASPYAGYIVILETEHIVENKLVPCVENRTDIHIQHFYVHRLATQWNADNNVGS